MSIIHLAILGELEARFCSLDQNTILVADLDPAITNVESDKLRNDIGVTLADRLMIKRLSSDLASVHEFLGKAAAYVSRLNTLNLMRANGENALILTVLKSRISGEFLARVAATAKIQNLDATFRSAAWGYVLNNPLYLNDTYDPSSIYHTLTSE